MLRNKQQLIKLIREDMALYDFSSARYTDVGIAKTINNIAQEHPTTLTGRGN